MFPTLQKAMAEYLADLVRKRQEKLTVYANTFIMHMVNQWLSSF